MDLEDCLRGLNSFLMSTFKERFCLNYDADDEVGSYRKFLEGFETDENLPNRVICAAYGSAGYHGFAEDYGEVMDAICKFYGKDVRIAALQELCEWVLKTAASELVKSLKNHIRVQTDRISK